MYLEAKNLYLTYQDQESFVDAVKNVSFVIDEPGYYGILGPSGSGKTSLLYLLAGIKSPTHGEVLFDDLVNNSRQNEIKSVRRNKIGFVFQFHFLINYLTALENVHIGSIKKDSEGLAHANKIIRDLQLDGLEHRYPYQLSGGQRQKVAIARAFSNHPQIVFVDEPTASLDPENGQIVIDYLNQFAKNGIVITVTHDKRILTKAKRIFQMSNSELVK